VKITLDIGQLIGAVVAVISFVSGAVLTTRKLTRPLLEMARDWREFRGDWYGTADRPGFPGHAGMGTRVAQAEQDISAIKAELQANGGGSLRDALRRIELQLRVTSQHSGAPVVQVQTPQPDSSHERQGVQV
jgi:hypothetical protein